MKMRFLMLAALALSLWVLPKSMIRAEWYDGGTFSVEGFFKPWADLWVCGWKC